MFNLKIIIASTRPGRKGPMLGSWIFQVAKENGGFDVSLLDLAIINLPFMDEPHHSRLKQYQHDHTKNWSKIIDEADAFIIVTPEYNFGYPASIKNALDYLFHEWNYKPVGFVSYGGIAGGTRSVQMLKQVVTAQKMMPVMESVNVPFFMNYISQEESFVPNEGMKNSANAMLSELSKWTRALKTLRNNNDGKMLA